uniref:Uncharacterized protein n=1 Tax=Arundo donax TaxID=35708 RepID=A0A0A8YXL6_ARUDO
MVQIIWVVADLLYQMVQI